MTTRTLIAALLAVAALALAACGGGDISTTIDGVEVNAGEEGMTIAGDGATIEAQGDGASIPADFPGSIPLPDGKLTSASKATIEGTTSWTLTYEGDEKAYDGYQSKIVNETGQESTFSMDQAGLRSETYAIDGHDVTTQLIDGVGITVLVMQQAQ